MASWKNCFTGLDKMEKRFFRLFFDATWGFLLRLLIGLIVIPAVLIDLALTVIGKTLKYLSTLLLLLIKPRELLTEEEEEMLDSDE